MVPTCDFGQENYDVRVNFLEIRIVIPDFLFIDLIDEPCLLILMDLFVQIVDVQPQSTGVGEYVGKQLSWIFGLEPLEVKVFLISIGQLIINQSSVELHCCTIFILKLVELLKLPNRSLLLLLQTQIKILLQQGCLELVDLGLMRTVVGFDMLAMTFFHLLRFEGFIQDIECVSVDFLLIDCVNGSDLTLVEGLQ